MVRPAHFGRTILHDCASYLRLHTAPQLYTIRIYRPDGSGGTAEKLIKVMVKAGDFGCLVKRSQT